MDMGQRVKTVVVGVGAWTVTFMGVRKILSKRSFDFCNRVVSLIHVAVALWLCSVSVKDWKHPLEPLASPAAPLQVPIYLNTTLLLPSMRANPYYYSFICLNFHYLLWLMTSTNMFNSILISPHPFMWDLAVEALQLIKPLFIC